MKKIVNNEKGNIGLIFSLIAAMAVIGVVSHVVSTYNLGKQAGKIKRENRGLKTELQVTKGKVVSESKKAAEKVKVSDEILNLRAQLKAAAITYKEAEGKREKKKAYKEVLRIRDELVKIERRSGK